VPTWQSFRQASGVSGQRAAAAEVERWQVLMPTRCARRSAGENIRAIAKGLQASATTVQKVLAAA
jgi:hypothetical protein